jgi:hypothetical protein
MKKVFVSAAFILTCAAATAQERFLPLKDFSFHGVTAQYQDDTTTVYSLLCTGMPKSNDKADSLIMAWRTAHPDATLRPVCSFSYYNEMGNRVTYTYSWLVSNMPVDPSLNVYLVRYGACSAVNMLWAKGPSLLQPSLDSYKRKKSETKVFIDKSTYKSFVARLQKAGAYTSKGK